MENQKVLEKINEIISLCLQVNGFEDRSTKIAGNKPAVFFEFSGHVCKFEVSIHSGGWEKDTRADMNFHFYLNKPINEAAISNCIRILTQLKEELEEEQAAS